MNKLFKNLKFKLIKMTDIISIKEIIYPDLRYSDCKIYRYYVLFNIIYFKKYIGSLSKTETKHILDNMMLRNKNLKIKWKSYEAY